MDIHLDHIGYNHHMPKMYTRTGDDGTTGVFGNERLAKYHPRLETIGTLDEASASLGLARAMSRSPKVKSILAETQNDLYTMMAEVAALPENGYRFPVLDLQRVHWLELQIDTISARLPMPQGFILPGDTRPGAALSIARTVVRRAERRVAQLIATGELTSQVILPYLNRLSSLCFILELEANHAAGKKTRPTRRDHAGQKS